MGTEHLLPDEMFAGLDRAGAIPLYSQVAARIEAAIADGSLPVGARLENEITMGERFQLSRPTMRRAIQVLVDQGLLVRRRGVGTQVVHGSITRGAELSSLFDDLAREQRHPTTKILSFEILEPTAELSAQLGIDVVAPVLHVRRLRSADEAPIAVLDNHLLDPEGITEEALEKHGMYELLRARGTTLRVARQVVGARAATTEESRRLDIPPGSAVLTLHRTAYNDSGEVVELGRHSYRPDRYSVEFTVVNK